MTGVAATEPALRHVTALVAPNAEETHVHLRRAVLIRHGETEWTLNGRHTGRTDIPLTDNGRVAARQLAPLTARVRFSLVLTSPMRRACETCELAGVAGQAQVEADLLEWNYGEYEGLTSHEIYARQAGWRVFTHGCPGGESPADVIARIRGVQRDVAMFAHGHVFRVFAARWLGLPPEAGSAFLLDPATVSVLSHYRGVPAVKCWNAPLVFSP
jgi:probable phosphoglycerate mutase